MSAILSLLAAITPAGGGGGDVEYYATNSGTGTTVNITLAAPLVNGAILVLGRYEPAAPWGNSATFDGAAMSLLGSIGIGGRNVYAHGLAVGNKAAGTYSAVHTINTYGIQIAQVIALNNVNQSTPFGTLAQQSTAGVSSMTLTPASAVGDMVFAVATIQGQAPHSTAPFGAGQTSIFAAGNGWSASRKAGAASTTTMVHYPDASAGMAMIAFAAKKA